MGKAGCLVISHQERVRAVVATARTRRRCYFSVTVVLG